MKTTHHLSESEIRQAVAAWVRIQDKSASGMEVEVTLHHSNGGHPYDDDSFTATASLKPKQHFEGKD